MFQPSVVAIAKLEPSTLTTHFVFYHGFIWRGHFMKHEREGWRGNVTDTWAVLHVTKSCQPDFVCYSH